MPFPYATLGDRHSDSKHPRYKEVIIKKPFSFHGKVVDVETRFKIVLKNLKEELKPVLIKYKGMHVKDPMLSFVKPRFGGKSFLEIGVTIWESPGHVKIRRKFILAQKKSKEEARKKAHERRVKTQAKYIESERKRNAEVDLQKLRAHAEAHGFVLVKKPKEISNER